MFLVSAQAYNQLCFECASIFNLGNYPGDGSYACFQNPVGRTINKEKLSQTKWEGLTKKVGKINSKKREGLTQTNERNRLKKMGRTDLNK